MRRDAPMTLLGGGELETNDLDWAHCFAPTIVAADGGAATALAAGRMPEAVIGDLDSLAPKARARLPEDRIHRVPEQDSTDFEKCLDRVAAPLLIGLGFMGARVDHTLAAFSALVGRDARVLLLGPHDVVFHAPGKVALDLPPGSRLSLFPMRPVTGHSEGLEWPIAGLSFAPGRCIGTSNRVTGPVRLAFDGPGMLVIVPRESRDAALAGLSNSGR